MATTQSYALGESTARQQFARFETKRGQDSGAGYERWRSWEYCPDTPRKGKQDVFVPHHRLLATLTCYPMDMPVGDVLSHLDGKDVHHTTGVEWCNFGDSPNFERGGLAVREHSSHSEITQAQMRAFAADDRKRAENDTPAFDQDRCDGCDAVADVLATSEDFDGELCLSCAKERSDGSPIEV